MEVRGYPLSKATLWATTVCRGHEIKIFKYPGLVRRGAAGMTISLPPAPYILIDADLFKKPKIFDRTLMHEMTHVMEYLFCHELITPVDLDCTPLAQCVERAFGDMLLGLRQLPAVPKCTTLPGRRKTQGQRTRAK